MPTKLKESQMFKRNKKIKYTGRFSKPKPRPSSKKKALGIGLISAAAVAISGAVAKRRDQK